MKAAVLLTDKNCYFVKQSMESDTHEVIFNGVEDGKKEKQTGVILGVQGRGPG